MIQSEDATPEPDALFDLNSDPGFVISRTYQQLRASIRKALGKQNLKLTPEETIILMTLFDLPAPIRMGELAALMKRDATTITRLLEGLVKKEFVQRQSDPDDRRAVQVCLSEWGITTVERLLPQLQNIRSQTVNGISPEDFEVTMRTLQSMQENLS